MTKVIKTRKGLDIRLKGSAEKVTTHVGLSGEFGLSPESFPGLSPKVTVREGCHVKAGDALFYRQEASVCNFCLTRKRCGYRGCQG